MAEQRTFNARVAGSSPARGTQVPVEIVQATAIAVSCKKADY